jgi:hypothetical protein
MTAERDASWIARTLLVVGVLLVGFGAFSLATAPARPSMPDDRGFLEGRKTIDDIGRANDAWMDANRARDAALFRGWASLLLGLGMVAGGAGLSRRGRALQYGLTEQYAAAIGRGIRGSTSGSAASRLAQLDDLRAKGLISDAEHAAKRQAILDQI